MGIFNSFLVFLCIWGIAAAQGVEGIYLTWLRDPTTTMTVQWLSLGEDPERGSTLAYRKRGEGGEWTEQGGSSLLYQKTKMRVHQVEIQGLEANSLYEFKVGGELEVYWFKTAPSTDEEPVRFVVGGDAYFYQYLFREMNLQIARLDPLFVVLGGDIAYTEHSSTLFKGKDWEERRWITFFSQWQSALVGQGGRLIPLVPVIGNHDIKKMQGKETPGFFQLFAMPEEGKAYRILDFSSYLSLVLLDSGHSAPIGGEQAVWLKEALKVRGEQGIRMAVYHIPAYPSVYDYKAASSQRIRYQWVSAFEEYGVDTVFEHHCHAYKRTHRIKGGKVDPEGVQYLGDGCWGVAPRSPKKGLWYIAKAEKVNHFWSVSLEKGRCLFESRDIKGKVIEQVETPCRVQGAVGASDLLLHSHELKCNPL